MSILVSNPEESCVLVGTCNTRAGRSSFNADGRREPRHGLSCDLKSDVVRAQAISNAFAAFKAGPLFFSSTAVSRPWNGCPVSLIRILHLEEGDPSRFSMVSLTRHNSRIHCVLLGLNRVKEVPSSQLVVRVQNLRSSEL